MLHELPITNVRLDACSEDWAQMTPTERGRHCQRCNREVVDFTQATVAELLWTRAAAPDGLVCGHFRRSQVAPAPPPVRLRPKLRWFLAAALLVLVQGFSAREAVAQVRRPATPAAHKTAVAPRPARRPTARRPKRRARPLPPVELSGLDEFVYLSGTAPMEPAEEELYPGLGLLRLMGYAQQHLLYPTTGSSTAQVLVRFTVDATGRVQDPTVERSAGPAFDTEALRVVGLLPPLPPPPARQQITLPIYFRP